jgi:hypothetical protein
MAARSIGKQLVRVWKFAHGNQGSMEILEEVERVVYKTSATFPHSALCSSLPLRRREYHYIEYAGARWPVRWSDEQPPTRWLPEGRPGAYELHLPSNWRELVEPPCTEAICQ